MINKKLEQNRYDFFLIWGHGLEYKKEIINIISKEDNFEIKMILNHEIKDIKKFVKEIYKYDYVPYFHLKSKTKYLLTTPKEAVFVFIKNKNPEEVWRFGHGTGHIESDIMVRYKNIIRDKFNEKKDDRRTENHVIHASDNEMQVNQILKHLNYNEGIRLFDRHIHKPLNIPYFIKIFEKYQILELNINDLACNMLVDHKVETVSIEDSFQYKFLLGFEKEYQEYIDKYLGTQLKAYYDLGKYKNISKSFDYLSKGYENSIIIVEKIDDKYIIVDGLHRASILKYQNKDKVIVMEIL